MMPKDDDTANASVKRVQPQPQPLKKPAQKAAKEASKSATSALLVGSAKDATAGLVAGVLDNAGKAVGGFFGKLAKGIETIGKGVLKLGSNILNGVVGNIGGFALGAANTLVVGVTTVATITTVVVAAVTGTISNQETAGSVFNHVINTDCEVATSGAITSGGGDGAEAGTLNTDEQTQKTIYIIYHVLKNKGYTDNQAIGLMVNINRESGFDETRIEGHEKRDVAYAQSFANAMDASEGGHRGIGLIQWTWPDDSRNMDKLAETLGKKWYDLDFQLIFLHTPMDKSGTTKYSALQSYLKRSAEHNWEDWQCVYYIMRYIEICHGTPKSNKSGFDSPANPNFNNWGYSHFYERCTTMKREAKEMMSTVQKLEALYGSDAEVQSNISTFSQEIQDDIIASITLDGLSSSGNSEFSDANACSEGAISYDGNTVGNSTIAQAAVEFSYPTKDQAVNNNGTELYQTVIRNLGLDAIYQSCDRVPKAAAAWCGADTQLKNIGNCNSMVVYFDSSEGSKIWQSLGKGHTSKDLQPGDVMIATSSDLGHAHGHVAVYVGNELIVQKHGASATPNANTVAASYEERSAGCELWDDNRIRHYRIYRCVHPMNDNKFANAGGDVKLLTSSDQSNTSDTKNDKKDDLTNKQNTKKHK